ncbi:MAG: hypothetical protein ACRDS9_11605 [Pseudonocardiaceae bacterium]
MERPSGDSSARAIYGEVSWEQVIPGRDAQRAQRRGGARLHEAIGLAVGQVINKFKTRKHLHLTITDTTLSVTRRQAHIDAEAALDGSTCSTPACPPTNSMHLA